MSMAGLAGVALLACAVVLWWNAWENRQDGWGWVGTSIGVGLLCAVMAVALIVGG